MFLSHSLHQQSINICCRTGSRCLSNWTNCTADLSTTDHLLRWAFMMTTFSNSVNFSRNKSRWVSRFVITVHFAFSRKNFTRNNCLLLLSSQASIHRKAGDVASGGHCDQMRRSLTSIRRPDDSYCSKWIENNEFKSVSVAERGASYDDVKRGGCLQEGFDSPNRDSGN